MRSGTWRLLICAVLIWSSCHTDEVVGSSEETFALDGFVRDDAPRTEVSAVCAELTAQTYAWVADPAHFVCDLDSDCVAIPDWGFIYDHGSSLSCWPKIVISKAGNVGFMALLNKMFDAKCTGPAGCNASVDHAYCKGHTCTR